MTAAGLYIYRNVLGNCMLDISQTCTLQFYWMRYPKYRSSLFTQTIWPCYVNSCFYCFLLRVLARVGYEDKNYGSVISDPLGDKY
jgi:hypothetical protein